jgi:mono/diheme cytochrome c family protein
MRIHPRLLLSASVVSALLGLCPTAQAQPGSAERGKQIFALAGGCGCHTPKDGPVGAGGVEIDTPFGKFFGSNITPDPETGIGAWTDDEIDAAIRRGRVRGKGAEAPVMPYYLYAGMSDEDARDLVAYLRTLAPVRRHSRAHERELPLARLAYRAWQILFDRSEPAPANAPADGALRGRYLVDHVSLCVDCHTPRTRLGSIDWSLYLAGAQQGPGASPVPNITPDETGIDDWDASDIQTVLKTGMMPDFDNVQGAMSEVVDGIGGGPGYKDAAESDRRAIAEYLKSVAPIRHEIETE